MDSITVFFSEVVIERVDEMKQIIEHPTPLQAGSLALFALCSPFSDTGSHIPRRRLSGLGPVNRSFLSALLSFS
jgi:hypothetical protein